MAAAPKPTLAELEALRKIQKREELRKAKAKERMEKAREEKANQGLQKCTIWIPGEYAAAMRVACSPFGALEKSRIANIIQAIASLSAGAHGVVMKSVPGEAVRSFTAVVMEHEDKAEDMAEFLAEWNAKKLEKACSEKALSEKAPEGDTITYNFKVASGPTLETDPVDSSPESM